MLAALALALALLAPAPTPPVTVQWDSGWHFASPVDTFPDLLPDAWEFAFNIEHAARGVTAIDVSITMEVETFLRCTSTRSVDTLVQGSASMRFPHAHDTLPFWMWPGWNGSTDFLVTIPANSEFILHLTQTEGPSYWSVPANELSLWLKSPIYGARIMYYPVITALDGVPVDPQDPNAHPGITIEVVGYNGQPVPLHLQSQGRASGEITYHY